MKRFWIVLCLVMLCLFTTSYVLAVNANQLSEQEIKSLVESLNLDDQSLTELDSFRIIIEPNNLSITDDLDKNWEHILLMGVDTDSLKINHGRSDAMLIASINTKTYEIKLCSLARDMLVDIPGLKAQNRINSANSFGGPLLAIKTVNEVLGLNVTNYVSVNFRGFSKIIDNLGGLEIELMPGEAGIIGVNRAEGKQHLDGEQALEYSRIRQLDNNFGRNERQRKALDSLLNQVKVMDIQQMMALLPDLLNSVSTNISTAQIVGLLPVLLNQKGGLSMLSLPAEGSYHFYQTEGGASVVTFDSELTIEAFHSFIRSADTQID